MNSLGLVLGIILLGAGAVDFWRRRRIADTPRAKAKTAAQGRVELEGTVVTAEPQRNAQGRACAFLETSVGKMVPTGKKDKNGKPEFEYVAVFSLKTRDPFYVKDETGLVQIDRSAAPGGSLWGLVMAMNYPDDEEYKKIRVAWGSLSDEARAIVAERARVASVPFPSVLSGKAEGGPYLLSERFLPQGDPIYVLGSFRAAPPAENAAGVSYGSVGNARGVSLRFALRREKDLLAESARRTWIYLLGGFLLIGVCGLDGAAKFDFDVLRHKRAQSEFLAAERSFQAELAAEAQIAAARAARTPQEKCGGGDADGCLAMGRESLDRRDVQGAREAYVRACAIQISASCVSFLRDYPEASVADPKDAGQRVAAILSDCAGPRPVNFKVIPHFVGGNLSGLRILEAPPSSSFRAGDVALPQDSFCLTPNGRGCDAGAFAKLRGDLCASAGVASIAVYRASEKTILDFKAK